MGSEHAGNLRWSSDTVDPVTTTMRCCGCWRAAISCTTRPFEAREPDRDDEVGPLAIDASASSASPADDLIAGQAQRDAIYPPQVGIVVDHEDRASFLHRLQRRYLF